MNIVDSSGWLEYFGAGPNANFFSDPIEDTDELLVPAISLYEVFKRILQQRGETEALNAVAFMQSGSVLPLTSAIALHAAHLSNALKIPLSASGMLASARDNAAVLWTQDADFEGLEGVQYTSSK